MKVLRLLLCYFTPVFSNTTVYSLIRDSDFSTYGIWNIQPMSAWCDRWCGGAPNWKESTGNYVLLSPKSKVTVTQSFNYTTLNISNYDTCDLIFYIRAVNTIDIVFNVIWGKQTINLNWATYLSTLQNSPSEWIEMHMVLTTMSDSLQFQMNTGSTSWLSLDDVSLFCSENTSWFVFDEWQIMFVVVILLMLYGMLHTLYVRTGMSCCVCRLCKRQPKFIKLQEEPVEIAMDLTAPNLKKKKSVLEDSDSDEMPQKSPFIEE